MSLFHPSASPREGTSALAQALSRTKGAAVAVLVFSAAVNVLSLTGSVFMLEVYDRVIPSRSLPTLMAIGLMTAMLFAFLGFFDVIRARILTRVSMAFAENLTKQVFSTSIAMRLSAGGEREPGRLQRDLDQIRSFLAGGGPAAFCDLPWLPVYLAICFACHPLIGCLAIIGAVVLVGVVFVNEYAMRRPLTESQRWAEERAGLMVAGERGAEVLTAMGMIDRFHGRWRAIDDEFLLRQREVLDATAVYGATSRVLRQALQSLMLGAGAWLVISGEATGGVMLAASIMTARALAPVEQSIAHWKTFSATRAAWKRLSLALGQARKADPRLNLPSPRARLTVEDVAIMPSGAPRAVIQGVNFALDAGSAVAVIGPSASGKSSLTRSLVGLWSPVRGCIRLDGAELFQWEGESLGRHIGYLPQDITLFDGTVAQNIARFDPEATSESVLAAAQAAGVHELILRLENGYETRVGEGGQRLSAGQRQRIALARALYGNPFLVVLDEPNSNLDQDGDQALIAAIGGVRARGGVVVLVAHRPSVLACCDRVLVLRDGRQLDFGPKDEVLTRLVPSVPVAAGSAPAGPRPAAPLRSFQTAAGYRS